MVKKVLSPRKTVAKLKAYDPGKHEVDINLSANENPYDLPEELKAQVVKVSADMAFNRYPDPEARDLRSAIARRYGLKPDNVVMGNGGDELLLSLLLAFGGESRCAVTFEPTFSMYKILCDVTSTSCVALRRRDDFTLPEAVAEKVKQAKGDIVFVCSPNNPSGNLATEDEIVSLLEETEALVVVDEAYEEFSRASIYKLLDTYPNLAILRTFSKAFSLAGLRVGYLLGSPEVIGNIKKVKLPYNLNAFSQAAAKILLENEDYFDKVIAEILTERERVFNAVQALSGLEAYPSSANFILIKSERSGPELWRKLLSKSILVRDFDRAAGLENCLRVTIGSPEQNSALIDVLANGG